MDKSQIEQIKQENAIAAAKGIAAGKVIGIVVGIIFIGLGVLPLLKGKIFGAILSMAFGAICLLIGILFRKKTENAVIDSAKSTQYGSDIADCQATLAKIEEIVTHEKLKSEFAYVADAVKADIKQASEIATKLGSINTMVANEANDQKLLETQNKLKDAQSAATPDDFVIKTLTEQLQFIEQMRKNKSSLETQLQKIKQNVSMVYTKLVLIDTSDASVKDEAGNDIQKILDRKISAQKFEQELP